MHIPSLYYLTVRGDKAAETRQVVIVRVGDDVECFHRAAELSVKVNFETLETPIPKRPPCILIRMGFTHMGKRLGSCIASCRVSNRACSP